MAWPKHHSNKSNRNNEFNVVDNSWNDNNPS